MTPANPSQLIALVLDGLMRRAPEAELVAALVARGVPVAEAPALFAAIKNAAQQGVQAELTGGHSGGPPSDPFLAEAFRAGQARFRGATSGVWVRRLVIATVVAIALWLLTRAL